MAFLLLPPPKSMFLRNSNTKNKKKERQGKKKKIETLEKRHMYRDRKIHREGETEKGERVLRGREGGKKERARGEVAQVNNYTTKKIPTVSPVLPTSTETAIYL